MQQKLADMVRYGTQTVPFYQKLAQQGEPDFQQLPLITKRMVLENREDFCSGEYSRFPKNQDLVLRRTSGSTGTYLRIQWDKSSDTQSLMELWYLRRKYYSIHPWDKYCYFYTTDYINNTLVAEQEMDYSADGLRLGFCKNQLTLPKLREVYTRILEFAPVWLLTQPSMAVLLAQCAEHYGLPEIPSLRYIELAGELLLPTTRAYLQTALGAVVANQYGANEFNSIAFECPHGHMHLMSSNVHLEVLDAETGQPMPQGEAGELYVSTLTNKAMPLLRYGIGDTGSLHSVNCPCGNKNPVLRLHRARSNDFVLQEDGGRISAYIFARPVEVINERIGSLIRQFQVEQNSYTGFTVRLVINPAYSGWAQEIERLFTENLKHPYFAQCSFRFEFTDALFQQSTGKLAYFTSKFNCKTSRGVV